MAEAVAAEVVAEVEAAEVVLAAAAEVGTKHCGDCFAVLAMTSRALIRREVALNPFGVDGRRLFCAGQALVPRARPGRGQATKFGDSSAVVKIRGAPFQGGAPWFCQGVGLD
ncbi:MAG: hypothetical protein ACYSTF_02245 [Planctomycetota bacterium]